MLALRGWEIEWFSSAYAGMDRHPSVDGIDFVYRGSQTSVHWEAFRRYRGTAAFDVVVDQVNTIPFYAHLYQSSPTIAWFQQLAREVWLYERPGLIGRFGYILEPMYLLPYRNRPIITISDSSKTSLREIGFRGQISVIPMAVDEAPADDVPVKDDSIIVVCRLTPSKRVEHAIEAAKLLNDQGWKGTLRIIGTGSQDYVRRLMQCAEGCKFIEFQGHVSREVRADLMDKACVIWLTSVREGWGMVISEAARHATPAVVYDVPGLRDSVRNGNTGLVVAASPDHLANATAAMLRDSWAGYATRALQVSKTMSWEATVERFENDILEARSLNSNAIHCSAG